jgi:hypothetical protein
MPVGLAEKKRIAEIAGRKAREMQDEIASVTAADFRVTTLVQIDQEGPITGTTWPSVALMRQALMRVAALWRAKAH